MWDGNMIANHNVILDTADGRQGSPLLPTAITTDAITPTEGVANAINLGAGLDTFANFTGFDAKIPGGGGGKYSVSTGGFVLLVAPDGSHSVFQYATNDGAELKGLTHVDIAQSGSEEADATAFPAGTMIYQCNSLGTPIGYALAMGKSALYYAKGAVSNEQIFHYDDFSNSGNEAHLSAIGIQSVYGMAVYQDTKQRIPGVQLIEAVRQIPGFSFTA